MAASDAILTPWQDVLIPAAGSLTMEGTDSVEDAYGTSLTINSDTQLSVCTGFDEGGFPINFLTDDRYLWTGTLLAGSTKFAGKDRRIANVTLSSGNIDLNKIKD